MEPPRRFNVTSWFLDRNVAEGRADRPALVTDDGATTYGDLAALTNRVGNVLLSLGVRREQRVLLALGDGVAFVAAWYAVLKIGAVTAEVYTYLRPKDYRYYLDYTEAEVVIVDGTTLGPFREAIAAGSRPRHLLVVGVPEAELLPGELSFDGLVSQAPQDLSAAPTTSDDIAIWKFTTGSTGAPKACVHPASSPWHSFQRYARGVLDLRADDLVLPVPKLFFGYARDLAALFPFGVGAAGLIFPDRATPERIFELIARHRPTILVNVPTMMSAMVAHPAAGAADLSCLRMCTSAGEALPEELGRKWDNAFGVDVLDGIGSSELYHIYLSNRPGQARAGTLGQVVPGYRARVLDDLGADAPDDEAGVLEVSGDTAALAYWGAPEKSAETFHGSTVRTGDLFSHDADGYFRYRGRADDLLKVGGRWVAPAEIENCLLGHPDVVECAVVGYHAEGLVLPMAFVQLRAGVDGSAERADTLRQFVRAALAAYKAPREVRFVTELPKTASGKLDRRALRELGTS
ncbi:benzoate-CoA ligase family protein [Solihabitans fulvus]|uniref:Benzoate-CoA ligase family protein n=1 Tax=Solihabitans fulvus TaxID=1892852 RepID=A0A5B2WVQ4_9PSEU|nr:benzoate-CoA ligase family protein [Solihabitans fulvus]